MFIQPLCPLASGLTITYNNMFSKETVALNSIYLILLVFL